MGVLRCFLWLMLSFLSLYVSASQLLPKPQTMVEAEGRFELDNTLVLKLSDTVAQTNVATLLPQRWLQQTGLVLKSSGKGKALSLYAKTANAIPAPDMQEQYQLEISADAIRIEAEDIVGIQRAIETLLQLIQQDANGYYLPLVQIKDEPRFGWRGLLLDPARRFLPLDTLKRQLDIMAAAKLNVLHLHLTDDQGWRFESLHYPKLQQVGGKDGFYSQQQLKQLVQYAADRGIRIVPEIDLPGHSAALGAAYPELMAKPELQGLITHWGVHQAVVDPTNPKLYQFISTLFAELAAVFPDPYVHIGGDEILPDHWLQSEHIVQFMQQQQLADAAALHSYFNRKLQALLQQQGKQMIGWDEVLDSPLPASVTVQSWRGRESLYQAAKSGHNAILSTGFYLDQPQTAAFHYRNDPLPAEVTVIDLTGYQHSRLWQFSMPRKRGKPVSGQLNLRHDDEGNSALLLQFNGKAVQQVQHFELEADSLTFSTDSWMGPLHGKLTLTRQLNGSVTVGNAAYPITGQAISEGTPLTPELLTLGEAAENNILGAEITLWGELVTAENIDTRLWPNGFAVAERLWSAANVTDIDDYYNRLPAFSRWAERSVGLLINQQQAAGFKALSKDHLDALTTFSQILEPAHYYHRLHAKSALNLYHRDADLTQLADYLSAEHLELRAFSLLIKGWQNDKQTTAMPAILSKLKSSRLAAAELAASKLQIQPIAAQSEALINSAIRLISQYQQQGYLSANARLAFQQQLDQAAVIQQEMVIALQRPLQQWLDAVPSSTVWLPAGTFTASAEGPAFDSKGHFYAVNYVNDGTIGKATSDGAASLYLTLPAGSTANGIVFDNQDTMYMADYTGHQVLKYQQGKLSVLVKNTHMHQPNDLAIASDDSLYASDPHWASGSGQLWRIDNQGNSYLVEAGMGTTNGISISPAQQYLYVNESVQRRIWRYRRLTDGSVSDKTLFARFSDYGLDGMRTNSQGDLFVTRYGKGTVVKLNQHGQVVAEYMLRQPFPTNLAIREGKNPALFVTMQQCGCVEKIALD